MKRKINKKKIFLVTIVFGLLSFFIVLFFINNNLKIQTLNISNQKKVSKKKNDKNEEKKEIITKDKSDNENEVIDVDTDENYINNENKKNDSKVINQETANLSKNDDKKNSKRENESKNVNNNTKKEIIQATKEYYCPQNYVLNENKCVYKITSSVLSRYKCDSGTLNGSKCITTSNTIITYSNYGSQAEACQSLYGSGQWDNCMCSKYGGTLQNQNCYKTNSIVKDATLEYYCPQNYNLEENNCVAYIENDAVLNYTCPQGYILNGTNCEK